jgi:hypothetical protein
MDDERKPRPVSGEIMTATQPRTGTSGSAPRRQDFSDADYEPVVQPDVQASRPSTGAKSAPDGLSLLAGGGAAAASGTPARGGPAFWSFGLLLVMLAFWVSGGHALVREFVPAIVGAPAQPLRITNVQSRVEPHNGRDVLFVTGVAENHGATARPMPPIEIAVTAPDGRMVRYNLGTRGTELKPGDRYSFSSRLEAPTNGVKTVSVTFLETLR